MFPEPIQVITHIYQVGLSRKMPDLYKCNIELSYYFIYVQKG